MKEINIEERDRILALPFISAQGYYKCLPVGLNMARRLFRRDEQELIDQGVPLFDTRPRVIPTSYFIKKYYGKVKVRT